MADPTETLAALLVEGALPGETAGFVDADRRAAAEVAQAALDARTPDRPGLVLTTGTAAGGKRLIRLAVANRDMPFLVDSIAVAVAAQGLAIDRILHPVIANPESRADGPVSLVYMEVERAEARVRRLLVDTIDTALDQVARAVSDWDAMKAAMARGADALADDRESAALLRWFLDANFTLLGWASYPDAGAAAGATLGIAGLLGDRLLAPEQRAKAQALFAAGRRAPLLLKSNEVSAVHRRAPLDLIVLPANGGIEIHAGLWTSAALAAAPAAIPVLRTRLDAMLAEFGFPRGGHAGKALDHAMTALPHDLLLALDEPTLERLSLTAMSLADRPRAELVLARDALDRHLFAFVWLPRDELTTARRTAIADLLAEAADAGVLSWSIDMDDAGVALVRYTLDRRRSQREPDEDALRTRIVAMVRGWEEAVEASLHALSGEAGRAARLALRWADALPPSYRQAADPDEAALDIERLATLLNAASRNVRLYRQPEDGAEVVRLKLYSLAPVMLSDVVPALENFGFRVSEEMSTLVAEGRLGHMHRFVLVLPGGDAAGLLTRCAVIEPAIADVLGGGAQDDRGENDRFNELVVSVGFAPPSVALLRALFRYLRQTGLAYSLATVAEALRRHPAIAQAIVDLFTAHHSPDIDDRDARAGAAEAAIEAGLAAVTAIDEDRVLRLLAAVVRATLRTNFFAPAATEALAFKFDSALVPGLPAPVPWREIWVYSPRVEGIHLRAGPVARGGLRWSDRRDDFRTEILGLMKAQRVKNAVIVPTGAKGGFYPKRLPPATNRDAWLAEGTESYRVFIRTLLSITDNLVEGQVVHPHGVVVRDGPDPYFVVAADKGTATFSDVANAIALERGFWLGDAFASGGSVGYDHKAMGITARGAWISVQRHFAELGTDVQSAAVDVVGCGDMSGDVFGNGLLLSRSVRLVAAFDHRHIFIDPNPDPAASFDERARLFALPRSSWADYDASLISAGGGVWPRSAKSIPLSAQAQLLLGTVATELEPSALIAAILKSPADLIWFGGIGTYVKAAAEANSAVGDPANDLHRVNAEDVRAKVIGEGANLGVTQAARIAFSLNGGRINTDFIDNSAGVDCSDHEVNIKIALNAEVAGGRLTLPDRNALLADMTDDVATDVLEDNRLQTLALSIAERGGAAAVPSLIRLIEVFEGSGRLDRAVEGLPSNDMLARRAQDGHGLTRPELAVLLATAKLALQDAIEVADLGADPAMTAEVLAAFPPAMRERHREAIEGHQLRRQIVATRIANRMVNRMGLVHPFELAEEEGASMGDIAAAFATGVDLFGIAPLWADIDAAQVSEGARLLMFEQVAVELRAIMADLLRAAEPGRSIGDTVAELRPEITVLDAQVDRLLREETRAQAADFAARLTAAGAPAPLVERIVRVAELDGSIGMATLSGRAGVDPVTIARAFTALGAALGLDWAQGAAMRANPVDPWERLLVAGLARDFGQMRLDFLARDAADVEAHVASWLEAQTARVRGLRTMIDRARGSAPTPAMLAQIAGQARVLLARS